MVQRPPPGDVRQNSNAGMLVAYAQMRASLVLKEIFISTRPPIFVPHPLCYFRSRYNAMKNTANTFMRFNLAKQAKEGGHDC